MYPNLMWTILLSRFQNLKKKEFRPNVLEVYKRRFRAARESYLEYLKNPGGWRPSFFRAVMLSESD